MDELEAGEFLAFVAAFPGFVDVEKAKERFLVEYHISSSRKYSRLKEDGTKLPNGDIHGKKKIYGRKGQKYESNWKDGFLHGEAIAWYDNGKIASKKVFANGRLHGLYEAWNENGVLTHHGMFENDAEEGEHISRQFPILKVTNWKRGQRHGPEKAFTCEGQMIRKTKYIDGKEESTTEYRNGKKKSKCSFLGGMKHGKEKIYDDAINYKMWEHGRLVLVQYHII